MEAKAEALGAGGNRLGHLHNSTQTGPHPSPELEQSIAEIRTMGSEVPRTEPQMGSIWISSVLPLYPQAPSVHRRCRTTAFSEPMPMPTDSCPPWGLLCGRCTYLHSKWLGIRQRLSLVSVLCFLSGASPGAELHRKEKGGWMRGPFVLCHLILSPVKSH